MRKKEDAYLSLQDCFIGSSAVSRETKCGNVDKILWVNLSSTWNQINI